MRHLSRQLYCTEVVSMILNKSDVSKFSLHKEISLILKHSCADTGLERKSGLESLENETNTVVESPQKRDCKGKDQSHSSTEMQKRVLIKIGSQNITSIRSP